MRSSWTRQNLHSDHRNTADARLISHLIYRNTLWFQYAILSPPSAAATYTQRLSWNALPVSCAEVQQRFWGCFECFEVTLRRVESFQHRQATDVSCPFIQIQPSSPAYQNQTQNLHIYMNTVQLLLADVSLSKKGVWQQNETLNCADICDIHLKISQITKPFNTFLLYQKEFQAQILK